MKWMIIILFLAFFDWSCNYNQKADELQKKEVALDQKEQELDLKEKSLQVKEEELLKKEKRFDSTMNNDTIHLTNQAVVGLWAVKMTCTETTCTGSAVGDNKTEQWDITTQE